MRTEKNTAAIVPNRLPMSQDSNHRSRGTRPASAWPQQCRSTFYFAAKDHVLPAGFTEANWNRAQRRRYKTDRNSREQVTNGWSQVRGRSLDEGKAFRRSAHQGCGRRSESADAER